MHWHDGMMNFVHNDKSHRDKSSREIKKELQAEMTSVHFNKINEPESTSINCKTKSQNVTSFIAIFFLNGNFLFQVLN